MDMENIELQQIWNPLQPLEVPCIIHEVLQYLSYADLRRCRSVSRSFNFEAIRILRKKSKIVLNCPWRLISFNLETLWKCLAVNRCCEAFQLINAHVSTPAMIIFLRKVGHTIKSFELKDSKWNTSDLENILTNIAVNLEELIIHGAIPVPCSRMLISTNSGISSSGSSNASSINKLRKIKTVDLQLYEKGMNEDDLKQFVIDILSSVCNLEVLRSHDNGKWRSRRERFQRLLFELIIDPDINLNLTKLRRINFSLSPLDDIQFQNFTAKNFPLQYLNLTILPCISSSVLHALLTSLRHTLLKLKLSFTCWRLTEIPTDIQLNKLQYLSLDWFNGSLKFVSHLKSLQVLILAEVDVNELFCEAETKRYCVPHTMLRRFEVYQHSGPSVMPETMRNVAKIFPKITTLVVGKLNDLSLRAVFECFPQVEDFSAIEGAFTDSGLTGIEMLICEKCNSPHLQKFCLGIYNEQLANDQKRYPGIYSMKHLRKLTIKSSYLSNISVIHGICFCSPDYLKHLSISSYELTFQSLHRILEVFNLDYLDTTSNFSHIAEIRYALKKMSGKTFILNGIRAPTTSRPATSFEINEFVSQFHDNVCRSVINNMKRNKVPPEQFLLSEISDFSTIFNAFEAMSPKISPKAMK